LDEKAIAAAAISAAEREALKQRADTAEDRKTALREAEAAAEKLAEEVSRAEAARAALPPGGAGDVPMPCPHCGEKVVLRRINLAESRLEKAETIAPAELKKRRLAIVDADGLVGR
jgi:predicted RNA-binding Zn-ribbon protein involved in translation (DUF1610 family)